MPAQMNLSHLEWPFFDERHRELAAWLGEGAAAQFAAGAHPGDVDAACRQLVRQLGEAGWLRHAVAGAAHGGAAEVIDTRAICMLREALAFHNGLADFAFAMQGLGSGAISLHGNAAQRERYLPRVARGQAIAAFALSEPDAGSDVAAMTCSAREDGDHYVLSGEKTWISNGGIADFYVVFARSRAQPSLGGTGGAGAGIAGAAGASGGKVKPARASDGITAFIVDAMSHGLEIAQRIEVIAPHPLATLRFNACRVPRSQVLGVEGQGFRIAMQTLDVFRTSVAAAALGFARRALHEGLERATSRKMFGQRLADMQLTQAKLAQMATTVDSAALLTYRAAWLRDRGRVITAEAAMAKMAATEGAQQVIDAAVQLWGGAGVASGNMVESLYREIRALRIYEGATEVQQLIIARELLKANERT